MADTTSAAWSLLFGVRRSVRYHMRRQRFFDRLDRAAGLASLMAGSSTVVALLASGSDDLRATITRLQRWVASAAPLGAHEHALSTIGDRHD